MTIRELKELCEKEIEKGNEDKDILICSFGDDSPPYSYHELEKGFEKFVDNFFTLG